MLPREEAFFAELYRVFPGAREMTGGGGAGMDPGAKALSGDDLPAPTAIDVLPPPVTSQGSLFEEAA